MPDDTSRARDDLVMEAATFAVGIDAPFGFATAKEARLLLLSLQYNNFVHLLLRMMHAPDSLATAMAGERNFRGRSRGRHLGTASVLRARLFVAVATISMCVPSVALCQTLPFRIRTPLGDSHLSAEIRVEAAHHETQIVVRTPRDSVRTTVPEAWSHVDLESVTLATGEVVGVLRAEGTRGRAAALITAVGARPSIPWIGRLDFHGDPGERVADWIEVVDRTGDGHPDIIVGQIREGIALCNGAAAPLHPRAWDSSSHALRAVVLRRLPADEEEIPLSATLTSPGPNGPPIVRSLRVIGASSEADHLGPPQALVDGRPETSWAEGRGGPGEGEFVVFRFGVPMPIRAIAFTPAALPGTRVPETLVLAGSRGPRLRVTLPEDAAGRVWLVPPAPLEWSCFSLIFADSAGEASTQTAIAEVEVYTDLDFAGGVDALVRDLVRDGRAGDQSAELLARLGPIGLSSLESAWDRLGERGRERALRVAAAPARAANPTGLRLAALGAEDPSEAVRTRALSILEDSGAPGRARAVEIASGDSPGADDAARLLAHAEQPFDVLLLLNAISREGGSERPALRDALAHGIALSTPERFEIVDGWRSTAPIAARAALSLGLAGDPRTISLALRIIGDSLEHAQVFVDRFRLTQALIRLEESTPAIDRWLAELALSAEEWMLRAAAIQALANRRPDITRRVLRDTYPRVRAAALEHTNDVAELRALAETDPWPLVRMAALDVLARETQGRSALETALADPAPSVRLRAIEHVTRLGFFSSAIRARLEDPQERARVLEAALRYVEQTCDVDAGPALLARVRRGTRPDAGPIEIEVAVQAVRAAIHLGGDMAADARTIAARGGDALRAAVQATQTDSEPCRPSR